VLYHELIGYQHVTHNPLLLGPHTETDGLVAPGDWADFFRYVGDTYNGILVPETDDRDIKSMLMQKMMAAEDGFDVHFKRDHQPPEVGEWLESENQLAGPANPTSCVLILDHDGFLEE
jgi:hypothetical protein